MALVNAAPRFTETSGFLTGLVKNPPRAACLDT